MSIDTEVFDEKCADEDQQEFVCEKSNRFSAAWKFLNENNKFITKDMKGIDFAIARIATFLNYPAAYLLSLFRAEYSPQNLGYRF